MKTEKNKILLIEPPFYRLFKDTYSLDIYPLSLGYLSNVVVRETDWDVMAYNADFNPKCEAMKVSYLGGVGFDNYLESLRDISRPIWSHIRSVISDYKPDVIGISVKSQNFRPACIVAELAKELNEETIIVVGGPHASMMGPDLLRYPYIDICVRGEGERTIVELLNAIGQGQAPSSVKGIIYRQDGQIIENGPRDLMEDLDSLSFPHENAPEVLKDYESYPKTAFRNIFATRGCPYNCFFCGSRKIWGRKVRFRSPKSVVREIKALQDKGLRSVNFSDDIFGVTRRNVSDLCSAMITNCPDIKWSCEMHTRLIDDETVLLMKKAGCYSIHLGIESGNNRILKEMRKNYTIEEAFDACRIIRRHGIEAHAFFIVGFPQETEESLRDTARAIRNIKTESVVFNIFTPYPGTEAFDFCKEKKLVGDDYDVSLYNHQSPHNCFCLNIDLKRFRESVSGLEKGIDRKNTLSRLRRAFSLNTLWRIKEQGLRASAEKAVRVFSGK